MRNFIVGLVLGLAVSAVAIKLPDPVSRDLLPECTGENRGAVAQVCEPELWVCDSMWKPVTDRCPSPSRSWMNIVPN